MNFGERLQKYRKKAGYDSAKDFSRIANISYSTYVTYEKTAWPSEDNLRKIATTLHVSIDDLLGYSLDEFEKCRNIVKPLFEVSGPNTPELIRTLYSVKDDTSGDKVRIAMKESKPGGTVSTFCPMLMDKKYFIDLVHKCATIPQDQILEKFRTAYMEEFFKHALENKPDKAQ